MDVAFTVMNYTLPVLMLAFCAWLAITTNKLRREMTKTVILMHQSFARRSIEVACSLFENGRVDEAVVFDNLAEKFEDRAARLQALEPRGPFRHFQRGGLRADQHRR